MMVRSTAVILAAGKGTRMKSDLPKVLFPVLGRPMIHWVLDALETSGVTRKIVVVGYRDDLVRSELAGRTGIEFALQAEQLGTGHAVQMCRPLLETGPTGPILVVAGDSPLIQPNSVRAVLNEFQQGGWDCFMGTLLKDNPFGLGRIVRDANGRFSRIVEQKDASEAEQAIREVNMSTYAFDRDGLLQALENLGNNNAQREYYLTDCPAYLLSVGKKVEAKPVLSDCEALSINTLDELKAVEAKMQEMGYPCAN
ncbi:Bifunctional protein GlmU [Pirellula sp. SH-Sr6A]|uniref:sugar phosphate nucleotidyltransferase n=1 Tax=Pirellula sp. SH-Sr6A TaxID=1632865 RepID=UPI00078B2220|nr:NTP transferase domain-containing protein [Pirellula sp. SH-Sr6A]AMV33922.1 Bifunctional protein GlmU [Pirellula sp. SH-Sr6A]